MCESAYFCSGSKMEPKKDVSSLGLDYFYDNDELADRKLIIIEKRMNAGESALHGKISSNSSGTSRQSSKSPRMVLRSSKSVGPLSPVNRCRETLKVTELKIHSVIFCAKSKYFKQLFLCSHMRETRQTDVEIYLGEGETEAFLVLCKLLYSDTSCLEKLFDGSELILAVVKLADRFMCDSVIEFCMDKVSCCPFKLKALNQITSMYDFLNSKCLSVCPEKVKKFEKDFHALIDRLLTPLDNGLIIEDASSNLSFKTLLYLLDHDDISKSEDTVLTLIICWVKEHKDQIDVQKDIPTLLERLKVSHLSPGFLINFVGPENNTLRLWHGFGVWYRSVLECMCVCANPVKPRKYLVDHEEDLSNEIRFRKNISSPHADLLRKELSRECCLLFTKYVTVILGNGILFQLCLAVKDEDMTLIVFSELVPQQWGLPHLKEYKTAISLTADVNDKIKSASSKVHRTLIKWEFEVDNFDLNLHFEEDFYAFYFGIRSVKYMPQTLNGLSTCSI